MSETIKAKSNKQVRKFLETVFGHAVDGVIAIWTKQDKQTNFFTTEQTDAMQAYIASQGTSQDTYYGVCLLRSGLATGRGKVEDVVAVPGFWVDIDIAHEAHKASHYPKSVEEALTIIQEIPMPPTLVINSGYGLHVYWLFKEPWLVETSEERAEIQQYSSEFQKTLQAKFRRHGYKIDNTSDLARVLRIPGTLNHKLHTAVPVEILTLNEANRYNPGDFEPYFVTEIVEATPMAPAKGLFQSRRQDQPYPPAYMENILGDPGCAWLKHCLQDSECLTEPEWYQSLTIANCCEEADPWAHQLSQRYRGYSQLETDQKLAHIRQGGYGPVTCAYIRQNFGEHCGTCRQGVKSPIVLGREQERKAANHKGEEKEQKETAQEVLLRLSKPLHLYHAEMDEAWIELPIKNHVKAAKIGSKEHRRWLTHAYYQEKGKGPGSEAVSQVFEILESQAIYEGDTRDVFLRVGKDGDTLYYDLGSETGQVVEVSKQGWQIINRAPILFKRTKNMTSQVQPAVKGDLSLIDKHIRLKSKDDQLLLRVYLVACLIPDIPHVISVLSGEKGASKTTTMRKIRKLIDPAIRETMVLPKSIDELTLQLNKNYMPSYDNIDYLTNEISDILCMAATGGGISKRELYTNDEEIILSFRRCVVLNGINNVVSRPDIVDRSVIAELERIEKQERKDEATLWQEFDRDRPSILGGMFDALAKAMTIYPTISVKELPRMADYAKWGYAIAEALGLGGQKFLDAYNRNQDRVNQEVIADHPVASAVVAFMADRKEWTGTVAALLGNLNEMAHKENMDTKDRLWPKRANILGRRLNEVKSNLQDMGICFSKEHDTAGTVITVTNAHGPTKHRRKRLPSRPSKNTEASSDAEWDLEDL